MKITVVKLIEGDPSDGYYTYINERLDTELEKLESRRQEARKRSQELRRDNNIEELRRLGIEIKRLETQIAEENKKPFLERVRAQYVRVRQPLQLVTPDPYDPLGDEPRQLVKGSSWWAYRRKILYVEDSHVVPREELPIRIKHFVQKDEKQFAKIKRQVEAFNNFDRMNAERRKRIPEEVRMFVWQRDEGKCVTCGSRERLEFDHIIPVALGGGTTERNIQLLCEACNRSKGTNL